jgi:hypothetical protein
VLVVKDQIVKLMHWAAELGIATELASTLRTIVRKLETALALWGGPQYTTHLTGGVVLRRWVDPLIVHYALFAAERVVFLLEVRAAPDHPLALD